MPGTLRLLQEFSNVRVEVESLTGSGSNNRPKMTLLLNYVNKTDKELVIGLPGLWADTFLLDSKGNTYRFEHGTGLGGSSPFPGLGGGILLHVPSKDSAAASLSFAVPCCPSPEVKKNSPFRFSSQQALVENDRPRSGLNLSIRDIPLAQ